jgi:benzoyl-CoA reductase/2-hydroxyglutaryl-CoA dehydratase subunit BcrC/BadD/HgdB
MRDMRSENMLSNTLREPFKEFYHIFSKRRRIEQYKKNGRKIIGTICNNVPEEIIHSLGAVPVRLIGDYENTPLANSKAPSWICSYARGVLEGGLSGDFNFVDGIVGATTDDTKLHLFSAYRFYVMPAFSYMVQFPYVNDELSFEFFTKELQRFAEKLSSFLSTNFSEERLLNSIKVYNEFRELCGELEELRRADTPKITASEWMSLMLASTAMLKEEFNSMVSARLDELKELDGMKDYRLRIHLSGTDFYHLGLLNLLEESGAAVVSDDLCTSAGYYSGLVDGNGVESLAKRYMGCTACVMTAHPGKLSVEERLSFIWRKIDESGAEAIVILKDRGCEVCGHQCPWIVMESELPVLVLDLDFPISMEQYRTRIEAFVEAHGGG